jgi:hypothetical protein
MRPKAIVFFEFFYVAAIAIGIIQRFASLPSTVRTFATLNSDIGIEASPASLVYGTMAITFFFYVVLWFFIARRASKLAKWIYVGIFVFASTMNVLAAARGNVSANPAILVFLLVSIIQAAAVAALFTPHAREWFDGKRAVDPDVFG